MDVINANGYRREGVLKHLELIKVSSSSLVYLDALKANVDSIFWAACVGILDYTSDIYDYRDPQRHRPPIQMGNHTLH